MSEVYKAMATVSASLLGLLVSFLAVHAGFSLVASFGLGALSLAFLVAYTLSTVFLLNSQDKENT